MRFLNFKFRNFYNATSVPLFFSSPRKRHQTKFVSENRKEENPKCRVLSLNEIGGMENVGARSFSLMLIVGDLNDRI